MNFEEINQFTYEYGQAYWQNNKYVIDPKRRKLVDLKIKTGGLSEYLAIKSSAFACYEISLAVDIISKNMLKLNVSLEDIFKFWYDNNLFRAYDSYQLQSSVNILAALNKAGLIHKCEMMDIDYRYYANERKTVYYRLIEVMNEESFISARVCFGADASSDHAITVTKDNVKKKVVSDTSWRREDNEMTKYITPFTIRWFTMIE